MNKLNLSVYCRKVRCQRQHIYPTTIGHVLNLFSFLRQSLVSVTMSITHSFEFLLRALDTSKKTKALHPQRYAISVPHRMTGCLISKVQGLINCANIIHMCLQQFAGCRARSKPGALFAGLSHKILLLRVRYSPNTPG